MEMKSKFEVEISVDDGWREIFKMYVYTNLCGIHVYHVKYVQNVDTQEIGTLRI